jgi:hypothetical protein
VEMGYKHPDHPQPLTWDYISEGTMMTSLVEDVYYYYFKKSMYIKNSKALTQFKNLVQRLYRFKLQRASTDKDLTDSVDYLLKPDAKPDPSFATHMGTSSSHVLALKIKTEDVAKFLKPIEIGIFFSFHLRKV